MKKYVLLFLILILMSVPSAFARSNYVLPYPSAMPGSKSYKVHLIWEELLKYWYFGNFGQFKYNLMESDKYLVEAKTLFEYNQYLLGNTALGKSNSYFLQAYPFLIRAQNENKDVIKSKLLLKQAALKHVETLQMLESVIPKTFTWQPEKSSPTILNLKNLLEESIAIRNKYL